MASKTRIFFGDLLRKYSVLKRGQRGARVVFIKQRSTLSQASRLRFLALGIPFVPSVYAGFWGATPVKQEEEKVEAPPPPPAEPVQSPEELLIEQADVLHADHKVDALYDLLISSKDSTSPDVLWRLARAATDKGKLIGKEPDRRTHIYEAYEVIKQALEITDDNSSVHKWYAILLDYVGEYEGTKQRIASAFLVRDHFMKAVELNPKDATSIYLMGYWCFLFAEMPWYTRKVAAVIFASPPTSTYEEALEYFIKAEVADPSFYSMNLLMLGKTYLRLGNKEQAQAYLTKAREYPQKTVDDKQAHTEAVELLQGMGIKS